MPIQTFPLLDMFTTFNEADLAQRSALRDAYLAPWRDHAPIQYLYELWPMAGVVCVLHHMESYVSILQHTVARARDELRGAIPFLLGKAHHYLEELDQIDP